VLSGSVTLLGFYLLLWDVLCSHRMEPLMVKDYITGILGTYGEGEV
jgi:hypothetical protein